MAGVNKVIIVGRLGNDPDVRTNPDGSVVATISVATSDVWNDKQSGERRENVEWHRIVLWQKLGEIAAQYLKKGAQVYVEGKLKTRKWQDQQGKEHYITEIIGNNLVMLGGRDQGEKNSQPTQAKPSGKPVQQEVMTDDELGDIPF